MNTTKPLPSTLAACDGIVVAGPECFEPEGVAALRDWFAETSRPVYACGPLIPHGPQAAAFEKAQSPEASKIESFLDAKLASHGDNSVIYVGIVPLFKLAGYPLTGDCATRSRLGQYSSLWSLRNLQLSSKLLWKRIFHS